MSCREVMVSFKAGGPTDMGAVLAEAQTVYEATGLTPAQLQARVADLEGVVRGFVAWMDHPSDGAYSDAELAKAREVLNRA
jgi:hypothetical protein